MKPTEPKPVICEKSLRHNFTPEEVAKLNVDFGTAYDSVASAEAEFDAVKSVHKSRITEAESRMTTLRATINAGFEWRLTECVVTFDLAKKEKSFWPKSPVMKAEFGEKPALVEPMTANDFQTELISAESIFDHRKELILWDAGQDRGLIVVGQRLNRWYSALRLIIGKNHLRGRLNSEQKSYKGRFEAITAARQMCEKWLDDEIASQGENFKEAVKAITIRMDEMANAEKDKVE